MYVKWDKIYVKCIETAMTAKMTFFKNFKFPNFSIFVRPDVTGTGTQKLDAGIGRRRWPGTLQGTHRGSEGQGKCCRDPQSSAAW
ncbi:unnamed protein product [Staurois parvus]|uniref:Uncharacterized protein n=1 Tax=Staurois parvus TaxID=386267 RepID=A0ABN9BJF4_9NEOB|nr:unnamed protein product [Staurois parvus]